MLRNNINIRDLFVYLKEGEDHATAQDEFVDLAQHGLNDRDLR